MTYPRLFRPVAPGSLGVGVVATLDAAQNILCIDSELFAQLTDHEQRELLRTHQPVTRVQLSVFTQPSTEIVEAAE